MEIELLKKGDKVVMHTCIEAEKYNGRIWTCEGDEFTKGKGIYAENVVFLEGFSGYFCTEYLQKVNVEETEGNIAEKYKEILKPFMSDLESELKGFEREFDFDFAIKNLIKRYKNQKESLRYWREKYPNEF